MQWASSTGDEILTFRPCFFARILLFLLDNFFPIRDDTSTCNKNKSTKKEHQQYNMIAPQSSNQSYQRSLNVI